jgi:hypothetical protein
MKHQRQAAAPTLSTTASIQECASNSFPLGSTAFDRKVSVTVSANDIVYALKDILLLVLAWQLYR